MLLSGRQVKQNIKSGSWSTNKDVEDLKFGPNSVDVTLNRFFYIANPNADVEQPIDLKKVSAEDLFIPYEGDSIILKPYSLVLGSVNEAIDCDRIVTIDGSYKIFAQHYDGRSTMGRMGIQSHVTAGFGDFGFKGSFTLEIINNSPWDIKLEAGMRIGQIFFTEVGFDAEKYDGYNQVDCKPQLPRLGKDRF